MGLNDLIMSLPCLTHFPRSVLQFKGPVWGLPKLEGGWMGVEFQEAPIGDCNGSVKVRDIDGAGSYFERGDSTGYGGGENGQRCQPTAQAHLCVIGCKCSQVSAACFN